MRVQHLLGADIIMAFDDCPPADCGAERLAQLPQFVTEKRSGDSAKGIFSKSLHYISIASKLRAEDHAQLVQQDWLMVRWLGDTSFADLPAAAHKQVRIRSEAASSSDFWARPSSSSWTVRQS